MNVKKACVSMLSVSALALSMSGPAFAAEQPQPQAAAVKSAVLKPASIETVGAWNKSISTTGGEVTLDTVYCKYDTILTISGFQEAQGTSARVRYQLREKISSYEVGPVISYVDVTNVNGYYSRAFATSVLSTDKTYVIQAVNNTSAPVTLRGNAILYYE
ncbi:MULTISPECIES: hypothetical protein [Bacillus]|nr:MULTISPECIES: hypothetical protein [Bacillus]QHZ45432.1 hypothetical protein M654_003480 [Bacillus sp. NSP9.1]